MFFSEQIIRTKVDRNISVLRRWQLIAAISSLAVESQLVKDIAIVKRLILENFRDRIVRMLLFYNKAYRRDDFLALVISMDSMLV